MTVALSVFECIIIAFTSSRVMLHAASAKRQTLSYFQNPKSSYEYFINKMWIEWKNIFEEKKEFIFQANKKWNSLNDNKEWSELIAIAPTPSKAKNKITNFFKSVAKKKDESSHTAVQITQIWKWDQNIWWRVTFS